jgi:hypothetical protein
MYRNRAGRRDDNLSVGAHASGSTVSGVWIIGNDEIPIRDGKAEDNRIELVTFADDKQFTTVAVVEGNELKGTWKDDTGRSGTWQGKRQSAAPK